MTKLEVNKKWCKGCGVCAALCPKKVLEIRDEKCTPVRPEDCIACRIYEIHCPDFAIFVRGEK